MAKFHLFKSKKFPNSALDVGERDDGTYFLPDAANVVAPEHNIFYSIEEIELLLDDQLTLIRPKTEVN